MGDAGERAHLAVLNCQMRLEEVNAINVWLHLQSAMKTGRYWPTRICRPSVMPPVGDVSAPDRGASGDL